MSCSFLIDVDSIELCSITLLVCFCELQAGLSGFYASFGESCGYGQEVFVLYVEKETSAYNLINILDFV